MSLLMRRRAMMVDGLDKIPFEEDLIVRLLADSSFDGRFVNLVDGTVFDNIGFDNPVYDKYLGMVNPNKPAESGGTRCISSAHSYTINGSSFYSVAMFKSVISYGIPVYMGNSKAGPSITMFANLPGHWGPKKIEFGDNFVDSSVSNSRPNGDRFFTLNKPSIFSIRTLVDDNFSRRFDLFGRGIDAPSSLSTPFMYREILLYNRPLTDGEDVIVKNYLKQKHSDLV